MFAESMSAAHFRTVRVRSWAAVWMIALLLGGLTTVIAAPAVVQAATLPGTAGNFVAVNQSRIVDTRDGTGGYTTVQPGSNVWRDYQALNVGGVPASNVAALAVTVTVVNAPTGNLASYPGSLQLAPNTSRPSTQTTFLAYSEYDTVSSTGMVKVGTDGKIAVRSDYPVNILIDVVGYFTIGNGAPAPGGFTAVPNFRFADTRTGVGGTTGKIVSGQNAVYTLTGAGGVPSTATAAYISVTVAQQTGPGFFQVFPTGTTPGTSSLNYPSSVVYTIGTVVDLNSSGQFTLKGTGAASAHMIIDVQGYFDGQASSSGFTPVITALATETLSVGTSTKKIAGTGNQIGLPQWSSSMTGVVVGLSTIRTSSTAASGFLKVWPSDETEPAEGTSISYSSADVVQSSTIIVRPGPDGFVNIRNVSTSGTIRVDFDLQGYFLNELALAPASGTSPTLSGNRSAAGPITRTLTDRSGLAINPTNGNLLYTQSLLNLAGIGPSVSVGVRYNSLNDQRPTLNMGLFESQLYRKPNGNLVYTAPDGGGYEYVPTSPGATTYVTPIGVNASLTRTGPNAAGGEWKLTFHPSQTVNVYSDDGSNIKLTETRDITGTNKLVYSYSNAKISQIVDSQGRVVTFAYASTTNPSQPTTITDTSLSRTITLTYDGPSGALSKIVDATGAETLFQYDTAKMLQYVTDGRGNVTKLTYDPPTRRLTNLTAANGTAQQAAYTMAYSASGCDAGLTCTTWTDPNTNTSKIFYNPALQVLKTTDPKGNAVSSTWTAHNDLATSKTALNDTTTYDTAAQTYNLTKVTSPTGGAGGAGAPGRAGEYVFPTAVGDGRVQDYRPTSVKDSQGNQTVMSYNGWGQATNIATPGGLGGTLTRTYDGDASTNCGGRTGQSGQLCTSTDGKGNVTSYTYNTAGNLTTVTPPAPLGAQSFTYDAAGRVTSQTDGRAIVSYTCYDANDRVTQTGPTACSTPGGVRYTYDPAGNMTQRVSAAGTSVYVYDAQNRPTSKADTFSTGNLTTTLTYDAAGNILTYHDGIGPITYNYDAADNLIGLSESGTGVSCGTAIVYPNSAGCTGFEYDANNQRTKTRFPSGVVNTTVYDSSSRVASIDAKNSAGTTLVSRVYTYALPPVGAGDPKDSSLVTNITDQAGVVSTYTYDQLNRLTTATAGANSSSWTYDNNSNRLSQTVNGVATHYAYNAADQLCWRAATTGTGCTTPAGGTAYTYDGNGNQLTGGISGANTWTANFDQLASTTTGGATNYTYAGSTNDQRVTAGGATLGTGLLGAITTSKTAGVTTRYIRDNKGTLIALRTTGSTPASSYYTTDRQGSILLMTDQAQATTASYTYDSFGSITAQSGTQAAANPWRYIGGFYDNVTGLTKLGARYYDPTIGRFNQPDPSGQEANRYLYAGSNPVTYSDPSGLSWLGEALGIVGEAISTVSGFFGGGPASVAGAAVGSAMEIAGAAIDGEDVGKEVVEGVIDTSAAGLGWLGKATGVEDWGVDAAQKTFEGTGKLLDWGTGELY